MNEQIAKLANESGFDVDKSGVFGNYSEMFRVQKFAQLIIKECSQITLDYKTHDHYMGWCDYQEEILKHFGTDK